MKTKKIPLLAKIALGIALGIVCGAFAPGVLVRITNTLTGIFDQFIRFMVPLIVVGLVAPAIADTGRKAGRMLLATVALAYLSTLLAGAFAFAVSSNIFPSMIERGSMTALAEGGREFASYVTVKFPPVLDVMSALILSFILGLGMVFRGASTLKGVTDEFRNIVTGVISSVIVPLLPFYIFGIFFDMTAAGKVKSVLVTFAAVVAVEAVLTLIVILAQYAAAGAYARVNPFKALWKMLPAYMTALGTSSSAATIPVTRNQAVAAGVREEVADFTIPLCATVHLAGSTVKIVACAVALLIAGGNTDLMTWTTFIKFIAMLGVVMIAAPGVPGGAVMASLAVAESMLGFTKGEIALFITLYIATDSFGTACNVTGDGAISLVVNRLFRGQGK